MGEMFARLIQLMSSLSARLTRVGVRTSWVLAVMVSVDVLPTRGVASVDDDTDGPT
jgi:hypothetical protein